VIDCGVDSSLFRPPPPAAGEGPRYLIAGSLIERKNVERLMQAFASLGTGTLTVAGSGPLEARLRASAPAGVTFLGRVEPGGMAALYGDCDVYCQPSLVEPQGQALLEALACGRPVVATRVGGPPEYLSDACGALVDPLDVASIADGMRRGGGARGAGAGRRGGGGAPPVGRRRRCCSWTVRAASGGCGCGRLSGRSWTSYCAGRLRLPGQLLDALQPPLDERPEAVVDAGLLGHPQRLLKRAPRLGELVRAALL